MRCLDMIEVNMRQAMGFKAFRIDGCLEHLGAEMEVTIQLLLHMNKQPGTSLSHSGEGHLLYLHKVIVTYYIHIPYSFLGLADYFVTQRVMAHGWIGYTGIDTEYETF